MIRPALKLLLIVVWTLLWYLPVWLAYALKKGAARDSLMRWYAKGALEIIGINLTVHGELSNKRPLLLVSNHLNYFDILMLASQGNIRFTPKSEIAGWPVIGHICKMTEAVFVNRRPDKIKAMSDNVRTQLAKGEVVSLFPESTTGNGLYVLPFKSGFFNLAEQDFDGKSLTIQPAAMTYTRIRKLPIDSTQWPAIAWYGDMVMAPHLWEFLKLGPLDAELHFLPTVTMDGPQDRKLLASACQQVISQKILDIRQRTRQK